MRTNEIFHDEFANQEMTVSHLSRVQRARVREFTLLWQHLEKTYRDFGSAFWYNTIPILITSHSSSIAVIEVGPAKIGSMREEMTDREIEAYTKRYHRMVKAKEAFEAAGGKYNLTFRTLSKI